MKVIEDALVDNHEMMYKIAWKYLENHDDILDAIQETAYKALRNSNKLRNQDFATTWIIRILINNCLQMLKEKKRIIKVEINVSLLGESYDLESKLELDETLLKMNKKYRDVIILKYIEGYKIKEIATIYNKSENTIKTWLRRGLESGRNEVLLYDEL